MIIKLAIKPMIVKAKTKDSLIAVGLHSRGTSFCICDVGWGHFDHEREYVYAMNMEKHRRKAKVLPNGYRKEISPSHWVGYVYRIPVSIVKKIKQNSRNFKLIVKAPLK